MSTFSRQDILDGLGRLGELAVQQGFHIQLTVVGGAAMVLGFNARLSTRDVDAIILSPKKRDWFAIWLVRLLKNRVGPKIGSTMAQKVIWLV